MVRQSRLYIKKGLEYVVLDCEISANVNDSLDIVSRNIKGWSESSVNNQSYDITANLTQSISMNSYYFLRDLKRNRTLIEWQNRTENVYISSGKAYISEINKTMSADAFVTFDISLKGFGKPKTNNNKNDVNVLADWNDYILINDTNNAIRTNNDG